MTRNSEISPDHQDADALEHVADLADLLIWEVDPATRSLAWISGTDVPNDFPLFDSLDQYLDLNHPDDRDGARQAFSRWLDGTQPLDIEHRIQLPSGKTVWLRSRGGARSPERSTLLGVAQDITPYRQWQADDNFLASVQNLLESTPGDDLSLRHIAALLRDHLGLAAVTFLDVSDADDRITLLHQSRALDAPVTRPGTTRPLSESVPPEIAAMLASGHPVVINDTAADPRLATQRDELERNGHRATLSIPYIQEGRWTMLLCASHRQPHIWQDRELRLLTEVSERTSLRLERTRVHLGLRRSEERFQSLFETMDEGFCIIEMIYDEDGAPQDYRFISVNPAFEKHTGIRDAVGKRMREIVPTHEDHWFEIYGEVDRTGKPIRFVNEAQGLDGRWFDLNAFPIGDAARHQVAVLFNDITERIRAAESLKDFERRVQRALEIDSVGIIFFKPDGPVTYANPSFLQMSGYTNRDIASGTVRWDTMTPPEWMPNARRAINEFLSMGRITPYEKEYIRKDGTRWWGLFAASRIDEHEGVKFIVDITAMKQAEAERDRLAEIVEDSNDAIIRCDPDGRIIDVNHAAIALYGYSRDEFLGKNIIDTAPPDRREEFAERYARMQCGERVPPWETIRFGRFGTRLQVEIRMSPIRNAHGAIVGCSGIVRDITERKRLEQAQEDFLAMASHDLKSPVTVLLGRAQLMRRRKTYDEASIRTIIDQARRIERLASDLQHVVHIESGQLEFHPTRVEFLTLVREAVDRVQTSATAFEFCTDLPEEPVFGTWDRTRIGQVIDNLLINAVKYSPEGGTITVCVTLDGEDVELRIADQGIGISPELQQRLFTRFYRADKDGISSGLGLGLYISRMLIEAHGGTISVTSTPGKGSTFIVRLPRNPVDGDASSHVNDTGAHAAS